MAILNKDTTIGDITDVYERLKNGGGAGQILENQAEIFNDYTNNNATASFSHAEGSYTNASGQSSHAEGDNTTASGDYSHAEGDSTTATGDGSHAEGCQTNAGYYSHAEGYSTTASGNYSHAEGGYTTAGYSSHAEGYSTTASGSYSHAEGGYTTASGQSSHAEGYYTIATHFQHVSGIYNKESAGPTSTASTTGDIFIIGNGTSPSNRKNAFRGTIAGKLYCQAAYSSSGADYAEYFEWEDGNPEDLDRRGLFVTLDGEKIKIATSKDDYILGVVSATPVVEGDSASEIWHKMYKRDIFGAIIDKEVEVPEHEDEITGEIIPAHTETQWELNPEFNAELEYVRREDRKETVMYDGPMIQNITQYVQKEGRYHIRVTAEYKHVTSSITFHLKNK